MKSIGKIAVYIFLTLFLFPFIGLLIQQILGITEMRATWPTIVFALIGPYFFTFSKWANDNIWNRKTNKTNKPNNTSNTSSELVVKPDVNNKTNKEVNQNLNSKNNNTLIYIIIGLLVAILLVVLVRSPEYQQTYTNKRETVKREIIEREKIPIEKIQKEQIKTNSAQVEQRVKPKPKLKSAWFRTINQSNDPFVEDYAYSYGVIKNKPSTKPMIKIKRSRLGLAPYEFYLSGLELNIIEFLGQNKITQPCDECGMELAFEIAFSPNDGRIWGAKKGLNYWTGYWGRTNGLQDYIKGDWSPHLKSLSESEHKFYLGGKIGLANDHNTSSSFVHQIKTKNKMFIRPVLIINQGKDIPDYKKTFDTIEFDLTGSTNSLSSYKQSTDPYSNDFFVKWDWD